MDDILNVRALIAELGLNRENPIEIRILLEVNDKRMAVFSSTQHGIQVLHRSVPREFHSLTEFTSETAMMMMYPGLGGQYMNRMIAQK